VEPPVDAPVARQAVESTEIVFSSVDVFNPHPFLSPDGRRAFFNTDYSGIPQIRTVEGFTYPD
jgi:hypothetical protein